MLLLFTSGAAGGVAPGVTLAASSSLITGTATAASVAAGKTLTATGSLSVVGSAVGNRAFYFSAAGADANDGLTTATPKQTIAALNALTLADGDQVLFRGGDTFSSAVAIAHTTSGVLYGSYGTGRATISITANAAGISVYNRDRVTVRDLILTGPGKATATQGGIVFYRDAGNITVGLIDNCTVSGFNDGIICGAETGLTVANITVSGCTAFNNKRSGINFFHVDRYGISNGLVTGCTTYTNGQGGIALGYCQNSAIRYSTAYSNGADIDAGVGIFLYACKDSVIEFCEAYDNLTPVVSDGDGFDVENSEGCTVQYCYAHGNEGAGFLFYNSAVTGGSSDGNTLRFCISENDVNRAGTGYGSIMVGTDSTSLNHTNLRIYNNTVYLARNGKAAVQWDDLDTTGIFVNNVIRVASGAVTRGGSGNFGSVTVNRNAWSGGTSYGTNAITGDPLLVAPGGNVTIGIWNPSALNGYRLNAGSPAIDVGVNIASTYGVAIGSADFFGNTIGTLPTNLGAYDGAGVSANASAGGVTLIAASALAAGQATGVTPAPGVVLTATATLLAGSAVGDHDANATGVTLTVVSALIAGLALGDTVGGSALIVVELAGQRKLFDALMGRRQLYDALIGVIEMPVADQDVELPVGDSRQLRFVVKDADGSSPDLTGATARWRVGRSANSRGGNIFVQKDTTSGIAIENDDTGPVVVVTLNPADTASLRPSIYYHEAEIVGADGSVWTISSGKLVLLPALIV